MISQKNIFNKIKNISRTQLKQMQCSEREFIRYRGIFFAFSLSNFDLSLIKDENKNTHKQKIISHKSTSYRYFLF